MSAFTTSAPATPRMMSAGLSWLSVKSFAEDCIKLIEQNGDSFLGLIETGFRVFQDITGGNYSAILVELSNTQKDLTAIVNAIKATFNLP